MKSGWTGHDTKLRQCHCHEVLCASVAGLCSDRSTGLMHESCLFEQAYSWDIWDNTEHSAPEIQEDLALSTHPANQEQQIEESAQPGELIKV